MASFHVSWLVLLLSLNTQAIDYEQLKGPIAQLRTFAKQPQLVSIVNAQSLPVSIPYMLEIDQRWRVDNQLHKELLNQDIQAKFDQMLSKQGVLFVELILMGSSGQTLGAVPITSDYWQGDEDKFTQVMSHHDVFIGTLEWDESSQVVSAQISVPVMSDGKVIGVLTGAVEASLKALSLTEVPED